MFNKVGYHYPQERIISLWGDVAPHVNKQRPPEPLVMRFNTFDCGHILHSNLVPNEFKLDDFQVRTPTDIIGQHIHLPKWDLTTGDGAANGWNYEDGSLSPGTVVERIQAINVFNEEADGECGRRGRRAGAAPSRTSPVWRRCRPSTRAIRVVWSKRARPRSSPSPIRSSAPVWATNTWAPAPPSSASSSTRSSTSAVTDRGLGMTFSHDHYGPSTFQQLGLYSSIIIEPANSQWRHNEHGTP